MIRVANLSLKYTKEFFALFEVSLSVKKGESVALVGAEESGKTSFLRVLARLENYNKGEIFIKDIPLKKLDFKNDISMGYIPATPVFLEKKSVKKNLEYVLKSKDMTKYDIEQKINESLIEYDLVKLKDEKIKKLTLFEKYIVSLIRLSYRPLELLLVDNIFDKVSDSEREKLVSEIEKHYSKKETTMLVATTSEEIAKRLCKRKVDFVLGTIVSDKKGTNNEIK